MEATKQWWGPRIWRILHCLAEFSDRSDCGLAWRSVLRTTAEILPCDLCKNHMRTANGTIGLVQSRTAAEMRTLLRHYLWSLHQGSATVGISEEDLTGFYGGDRTTILQSVRVGVREVDQAFRRLHVLDRFHEGGLQAWVHAVDHLSRILWTLELPPLPTRGRGRR
jgi:hypothetical protein